MTRIREEEEDYSQAYNNVRVSGYFKDRNACMEHLLH